MRSEKAWIRGRGGAFLDGGTSLVVAGPWALFGYSVFIRTADAQRPNA
jgi:hypothetical protein